MKKLKMIFLVLLSALSVAGCNSSKKQTYKSQMNEAGGLGYTVYETKSYYYYYSFEFYFSYAYIDTRTNAEVKGRFQFTWEYAKTFKSLNDMYKIFMPGRDLKGFKLYFANRYTWDDRRYYTGKGNNVAFSLSKDVFKEMRNDFISFKEDGGTVCKSSGGYYLGNDKPTYVIVKRYRLTTDKIIYFNYSGN